jgi:hypothetical protein
MASTKDSRSALGSREQIDSLLDNPNVSKIGITVHSHFTTDAAADDTTIYTVPSGKTLLVTEFGGVKEDGAGMFDIYDSSGDSATGSVVMGVYYGTGAGEGFKVTQYTVPVVIKNGLTIKGADMANSKHYWWVVKGWLV